MVEHPRQQLQRESSGGGRIDWYWEVGRRQRSRERGSFGDTAGSRGGLASAGPAAEALPCCPLQATEDGPNLEADEEAEEEEGSSTPWHPPPPPPPPLAYPPPPPPAPPQLGTQRPISAATAAAAAAGGGGRPPLGPLSRNTSRELFPVSSRGGGSARSTPSSSRGPSEVSSGVTVIIEWDDESESEEEEGQEGIEAVDRREGSEPWRLLGPATTLTEEQRREAALRKALQSLAAHRQQQAEDRAASGTSSSPVAGIPAKAPLSPCPVSS